MKTPEQIVADFNPYYDDKHTTGIMVKIAKACFAECEKTHKFGVTPIQFQDSLDQVRTVGKQEGRQELAKEILKITDWANGRSCQEDCIKVRELCERKTAKAVGRNITDLGADSQQQNEACGANPIKVGSSQVEGTAVALPAADIPRLKRERERAYWLLKAQQDRPSYAKRVKGIRKAQEEYNKICKDYEEATKTK